MVGSTSRLPFTVETLISFSHNSLQHLVALSTKHHCPDFFKTEADLAPAAQQIHNWFPSTINEVHRRFIILLFLFWQTAFSESRSQPCHLSSTLCSSARTRPTPILFRDVSDDTHQLPTAKFCRKIRIHPDKKTIYKRFKHAPATHWMIFSSEGRRKSLGNIATCEKNWMAIGLFNLLFLIFNPWRRSKCDLKQLIYWATNAERHS